VTDDPRTRAYLTAIGFPPEEVDDRDRILALLFSQVGSMVRKQEAILQRLDRLEEAERAPEPEEPEHENGEGP
jgi:hypothetical protein